ncbi:MAG: DUF6161 domain-containing protein [Phycisphaerales bacterium JB059]
MADASSVAIAPRDGGSKQSFQSIQSVRNWSSAQIEGWNWIGRSQPRAFEKLKHGCDTIVSLAEGTDWSSAEERAALRVKLERLVDEGKNIPHERTFGRFILSLREQEQEAAATAVVLELAVPFNGDMTTSALRGLAAWHSFTQGLPASGNKAALELEEAKKSVRSWLNEKQEKVGKVERDFESIKRTFEGYMSLRIPDDYWARRSLSMKIASGVWAFLFVAVVLMAMFVVHGYISDELLDETATNFHPWAAIRAMALGVLGLWLIRFVAKNLYSSLHLAIDAAERRTMIRTYLALEKDGGLQPEDRKLILEPLFRPTADGLVKEDGGQPQIVGLDKLLATR